MKTIVFINIILSVIMFSDVKKIKNELASKKCSDLMDICDIKMKFKGFLSVLILQSILLLFVLFILCVK